MEPFYFTFQHQANSEALTGVHQITSASTLGRRLRRCRVLLKQGSNLGASFCVCMKPSLCKHDLSSGWMVRARSRGPARTVLLWWMDGNTHKKHTHPCDSSWCLCLVTGLSDVQRVLPSDGHAQSHVQLHVGPADGFTPGLTRLQQEA